MQSQFPEQLKSLIRSPLRIKAELVSDTSSEILWGKITLAEEIASWFPIISGGSHQHHSSSRPGQCDVGSKRYCDSVGLGQLDETILFWKENEIYAYNVKNKMMPIKDHVGVMSLTRLSEGKTKFTWYQYYNLTGYMMRFFFSPMMVFFMKWGLKNLTKQLGNGEVSVELKG